MNYSVESAMREELLERYIYWESPRITRQKQGHSMFYKVFHPSEKIQTEL